MAGRSSLSFFFAFRQLSFADGDNSALKLGNGFDFSQFRLQSELFFFLEEFGFILIQNPAIRSDESPALEQIARILHDFSAVIDEFGRAYADCRIEKHEAEQIRNRWETLKRVLEQFVLACETGKYDNKKESDHV